MAEPLDWRRADLRATRDLTHDVRLFEIEPFGGFLPPAPGSHLQFTVEIDGRPDTRSYSVVGPCTDRLYRVAVKRLPHSRGGSDYMWRLVPGASMRIAGPRNHFELSRGRPQYLLLAGGIGITPIFTMALALRRRGADFRLLYACRSQHDVALGEELRAEIGERLEVYLDEAGQRIDLEREIARLAPGGEAYVCGPIGMLDAAKRAWADSGRPVEGLRFETFGNSGRYASEPFTVTIPRLDKRIEVPANRTLLEALEAAGVEMIHDCRRGECGLCALDILHTDGIVDHRDVFFSDEQKAEGRKLCTCVSRVVRGGIVLDTPDRFA